MFEMDSFAVHSQFSRSEEKISMLTRARFHGVSDTIANSTEKFYQ